MDNGGWRWASLDGEQLKLVAEAEQTLGVDTLLVYQQSGNGGEIPTTELDTAALNESQLECLQGLEKQLQAVVVAHKAH